MEDEFAKAYIKPGLGRKSVSMTLHDDVIERSELRTAIDRGLARFISRRLIACGIRPDRVNLKEKKVGLREKKTGSRPAK